MVTNKPVRMTTQKRTASPKKLNYTQVMKDLHTVLENHGITGRIDTMMFADDTPCRCADGSPGVLRVVGGKLKCVCD